MATKRRYLEIKWKDGDEITTKLVDATQVDNSPLYVHKAAFDRYCWTISHECGYAVTHKPGTFNQAVSMIRDILPLMDWNFTTPDEFVTKDSQRVKHYLGLSVDEQERIVSDSSKEEELLDIYGYELVTDACTDYIHSGRAPGICMNTGCNYTVDIEQDESAGLCAECHTYTVQSLFVIIGII